MRTLLLSATFAAALNDTVPLCAPGDASPGCDFAVATLASAPSLLEFELFIRTLTRVDPRRRIYAAVDGAAETWLKDLGHPHAVALRVLDRYGTDGRDGRKRQHNNASAHDSWLDLQLEKTTAMAAALDAGHAGVPELRVEPCLASRSVCFLDERRESNRPVRV